MKPATLATLLLSLSLLAACGAAPAAPPDDNAIGTAVAQTVAAQAPAASPAPTASPASTAAPQPTAAPAAAAAATSPSGGATPQDDAGSGADAGNSEAQALALTLNPAAPLKGALPPGDEADYYQADLPAGSKVRLNLLVAADGLPLYVAMLRDGELTLESGVIGDGDRLDRTWLLSSAEGGTYLIRVTPFPTLDPKTASYEFSVEATPQADGGAEGDAADSAEAAEEISAGGPQQGELGWGDKYDYYTFRAAPGSSITLSLTAKDGGSVYGRVYRDGQLAIESALVNDDSPYTTRWLLSGDGEEGLYTLEIERFSQRDYTVVVYGFEIEAAQQADGGAEGDAGDREATARDTALAQTLTGEIGGQDERDTYRLTLTEPTQLLLSGRIPEEGEGNVRMSLWRDGAELGGISFSVGTPARLSGSEPLAAGEYFLVVTGRGDYQIEVGTE